MRMRSFGRWAPWVLIVAAVALLVLGLISSDREMIVAGAVIGAAWVLAFPVAGVLIGKDADKGD